jgi:hypothetical protein
MTNRGAAAAAMVLSALGVTTAEANDRDIRSIMLSATACQVDRNSPFEADPFKGPESISRFTRGSYTL